MNNLAIFEYKDHEVRVIQDESGKPWWIAADVCRILELKNPTKAIASLDEDERSNFKLGRQGKTNIVNESGLYALIFKSKKPAAKEFKRWIVHEVLPALNNQGFYSVGQQQSGISDATVLAILEEMRADREDRRKRDDRQMEILLTIVQCLANNQPVQNNNTVVHFIPPSSPGRYEPGNKRTEIIVGASEKDKEMIRQLAKEDGVAMNAFLVGLARKEAAARNRT
ncbi:MAG: hypothetical protein A4E65_02393 [Syntrophorhabdus sp. PtaU1.Bin153]|nr:MAG: hypothetical protein A4E65_02393 [Syntrophorhabdus sp. PtaU1.Bin153]